MGQGGFLEETVEKWDFPDQKKSGNEKLWNEKVDVTKKVGKLTNHTAVQYRTVQYM